MVIRIFLSIAAASMLAVAGLIAPMPGVSTADAATSVSITVRCYSNPEKTTIKNTGTLSFKVQKIGSTYHAYSYEPFSVNKTLAPGQSVTYVTGARASGPTMLTHNYIYVDSGQDGVRVKTSVGTFTKDC